MLHATTDCPPRETIAHVAQAMDEYRRQGIAITPLDLQAWAITLRDALKRLDDE